MCFNSMDSSIHVPLTAGTEAQGTWRKMGYWDIEASTEASFLTAPFQSNCLGGSITASITGMY